MKKTLIPTCAAMTAPTFAAFIAPSPSLAAEITIADLAHRWKFNA